MKRQRISEKDQRTMAAVAELQRKRMAAGTCRHCGGPVPCWSAFGDERVGVSFQSARKKVRR